MVILTLLYDKAYVGFENNLNLRLFIISDRKNSSQTEVILITHTVLNQALQIILQQGYCISKMKNSTTRYITRQIHNEREAQLDKTQSKFNRKPVQLKQSKKKYRDITKEDQRICFMSPQRISMLLTANDNSFRSGKSPSIPNYFHSPSFLPEDQSLIHNLENETNQNCKMNDSLLSMYNELNIQKEEEIMSLRSQVTRLTQIVEQHRAQQNSWKNKEKEMEGLQEYLMKRESYICDIHQETVQLNEKNLRLQKEKEMVLKEAEYFRKIFDRQREQNQVELKSMRAQISTLKQENQRVSRQNKEIKDQLKELQQQHSRRLLMKSQSLKNLSAPDDDDYQTNSPIKDQQDSSLLKDHGLGCSLKLKIVDRDQLAKRSYHALLSSRSSKIQPREFEDDEDLYKKSKVSSKKCGCRAIIESLNQKIRYNEIQIDILKRVKAKGESLRTENEKLKKHNTTLLNRIEYLCERHKKEPRKRKDSDSSLELSLSPSHKNHRL